MGEKCASIIVFAFEVWLVMLKLVNNLILVCSFSICEAAVVEKVKSDTPLEDLWEGVVAPLRSSEGSVGSGSSPFASQGRPKKQLTQYISFMTECEMMFQVEGRYTAVRQLGEAPGGWVCGGPARCYGYAQEGKSILDCCLAKERVGWDSALEVFTSGRVHFGNFDEMEGILRIVHESFLPMWKGACFAFPMLDEGEKKAYDALYRSLTLMALGGGATFEKQSVLAFSKQRPCQVVLEAHNLLCKKEVTAQDIEAFRVNRVLPRIESIKAVLREGRSDFGFALELWFGQAEL